MDHRIREATTNITGHVLKLDLGGSSLGGHINNSLLVLKHLQHLDLSQYNFAGSIPEFIGSLANLRYLNLSRAGFYSPIPHQLGNLSVDPHLALTFMHLVLPSVATPGDHMASFSWLLWNQIVLLEEPLEWRHLLENIQRGFFLLEGSVFCRRKWCFSGGQRDIF